MVGNKNPFAKEVIKASQRLQVRGKVQGDLKKHGNLPLKTEDPQ